MSILPKTGNRGIALIVTLTLITLLVTLSLELNRQIRGSVVDSAVFRDRTTLRHMLRSGVNIAEGLLVRDKQDTEVDSVQEDWARPETIEPYLSELPFDEGELAVEISDEMARIQVNALVAFPDKKALNESQHKLWSRFIRLMLARQEETEVSFFDDLLEPESIINPIKDWLDSRDDDAITGLTGAEDAYYRDLMPPYSCRNGPIRHINELLRVKGITREMFYAPETAMTGLSRYLTVFGMKAGENEVRYPGKININTAEMPVIAGLLPEEQEFLAPEIVAWREEKEGGEYLHELTDAQWYQQVPGLGEVEIDPELITTKSDIFRIDCKAKINDATMAAQVVVRREKESESGKWKCRVLRWRYE